MVIDWIDHCVSALLAVARWLVIPVVVLLFLQWPLRTGVGALSREANDLGQWLFALYVAMSITAATRAGVHLSADALARHYPHARHRRIARLGTIVAVIPWSVFVLVASKGLVLNSLAQLERFPDTINPGYFLIKAALWLLAALMLIDGIIMLVRPYRPTAP
jgi:TRAP-type mannitol/chloroaromatic compound transport system permease small subunit